MKIYNEEIKRMHKLLRKAIKQKQDGYSKNNITKMNETIHKQDILLMNMKERNAKLTVTLKSKEELNNELQRKMLKLSKEMNKVKERKKKNTKNKKEFKKVSKEIIQINDELLRAKYTHKTEIQKQYEAKINKMLQKQAELKKSLEEKVTILKNSKKKNKIGEESKEDLEKEVNELKNKAEEYKKSLDKIKMPSLNLVNKEELTNIIWAIKLTIMDTKIEQENIQYVY